MQKGTIKHTKGRVIIKVNLDSKNHYGRIFTPFKNTNQFDRREYAVTNAIVVSAEEIAENSEVLIEHNSVHDTNRIFEYKDDNPNIQYFSIPEMECYVWRKSIADSVTLGMDGSEKWKQYMGEWKPTKYYAIGERVFKPYQGSLKNIQPERVKNTLLIKTGEFKNKIVHTLANSDYVIIYQDENGKPAEILTCFHIEDEEELNNPRLSSKEEIICVDNGLTEQWLNGELLTGLTANDCKPKSELVYEQ